MENHEKIIIEKETQEKIDPRYQKIASGIVRNPTGMLRRLFPKEFEELYKELQEKYKKYTRSSFDFPGTMSIDRESLEIEEGEKVLKDFEAELGENEEKAKNLLREKSLEEIYKKGKTIVDNLTKEKAFSIAENIARNLLSEEEEKEFYQKYFDSEFEELSKLKDENEKNQKAIDIFQRFINKGEIREDELLKAAEFISDKRRSSLLGLIEKALGVNKIRKVSENIANRIHDNAYDNVQWLLEKGHNYEAREKFEKYEKAGILNIDNEKDFELYQKITEK